MSCCRKRTKTVNVNAALSLARSDVTKGRLGNSTANQPSGRTQSSRHPRRILRQQHKYQNNMRLHDLIITRSQKINPKKRQKKDHLFRNERLRVPGTAPAAGAFRWCGRRRLSAATPTPGVSPEAPRSNPPPTLRPQLRKRRRCPSRRSVPQD